MSETSIPTTTTITQHPSSPETTAKAQSAINSLSTILTTIPPSLLSSQNPAFALLHDSDISDQISSHLRNPDSGSGDNNLCRWFYDTFQSNDSNLQLIVLRYLPTIVGLYLSRVSLRNTLAGFEAVLLALYAHETTSRAGQALTVKIPDLSNPSIYHESKPNMIATNVSLAIISPSLDPHGTMRSTKRARIVGVALELYYNKISFMPTKSKLDFCEFCDIWSGQESDNENKAKGRVPLPWELLQPILRILGHCLFGISDNKELVEAARKSCKRLYTRALHDLNAKAILATESLLKLCDTTEKVNVIDYTELPIEDVDVVSL